MIITKTNLFFSIVLSLFISNSHADEHYDAMDTSMIHNSSMPYGLKPSMAVAVKGINRILNGMAGLVGTITNSG